VPNFGKEKRGQWQRWNVNELARTEGKRGDTQEGGSKLCVGSWGPIGAEQLLGRPHGGERMGRVRTGVVCRKKG